MSKATQVEVQITVRYRDDDFDAVGSRAQASCTVPMQDFDKFSRKLKKEICLDEGKKFSSVEKRKALADYLTGVTVASVPGAER